ARSDGTRERIAREDPRERAARRRGAGDRALHRALAQEGPERPAGRAHPVRLLFPRVMIIRALLLAGLAAIGWLVFVRRNKLPFHIVLVFAILGIGAAAVLAPEKTLDDIALAFGVGRGVDLITYLFEVGAMFVLLHYYTKFVDLQRQL